MLADRRWHFSSQAVEVKVCYFTLDRNSDFVFSLASSINADSPLVILSRSSAMALWPLQLSSWTAVAIISFGLYIFYLAIYRLFFSPISKFPGPKLAALTFWYAKHFEK